MGWFSMALVEVLKYFPKDHPKYDSLLNLFGNIAEGIKNTQDPESGLWFQVVDKGNLSDNWLESSGSGMMIYAVKTAVDCGFIDKSYLTVAQKGWTGLKKKISLDNKGLPVINGFAAAMNVLNDYAAYVDKSRYVESCPPSTHPHGYCGVLMAASAMELAKTKYRLTISFSGRGSVVDNTGEMFHDSGSTVILTAVAENGWRLSEWSGDAQGGDTTAAIIMDREKTVTATFVPASSVGSEARWANGGIVVGLEGRRAGIMLSNEKIRNASINLFDCCGRRVYSVSGGFFDAWKRCYYGKNDQGPGAGLYIIQIRPADQKSVTCSLHFKN